MSENRLYAKIPVGTIWLDVYRQELIDIISPLDDEEIDGIIIAFSRKQKSGLSPEATSSPLHLENRTC